MRKFVTVRRVLIFASFIIVVLGIALATKAILNDFDHWQQVYPDCAEGSECKRLATLFAQDYTESKDLAKAFLTLLVAVFVGSITFSEKIVDVKTSGVWAKATMILCWICILIAIVAC